MKNIINEIANSLNKTTNEKSTRIIFSDSSYKSVDFNESYFHEIKNVESNRKIAFVDGGNASIIETPNLMVQFIRLYAVIYQSNKKIKSIKHEFFILVQIASENKLVFSTKTFPLDNNISIEKSDLEFDFLDKTLRGKEEPAKISSVANCARRFGELLLAKKIIDEFDEKDMVILDGTLQSKITNERKYLEMLFKKADTKNIFVGGLSKTNQLITDSGDSALVALANLANLDTWYYYPVAENNHVEIFITKLHKLSRHIFRFELLRNPKISLDEIFSLLTVNSRDPVFFGYPFGLIVADKNARVSNNEKEYLKTIFSSKIDLGSYENSLNAHNILDNIG